MEGYSLIEHIVLIKEDDKLTERLTEALMVPDGNITRELFKKKVAAMLRYDVWTIRQFADLTGYAESTIANKTRPNFNKKGDLITELDYCYPFSNLKGLGPKFIIRNAKSEKLLP